LKKYEKHFQTLFICNSDEKQTEPKTAAVPVLFIFIDD